jgi:SsrA-binding protein
MAAVKKTESSQEKISVAINRKARMLYEIFETYEAGLELNGAEVKSLRLGRLSLDGCFGQAKNGELYLFNLHIPHYSFAAGGLPIDSRRSRKLLLHRIEIKKISSQIDTKGMTLVPLEIYFKRGWAKASLGIARGKKGPDRREELHKKAISREAEKSFKGRFKA